MGISRLFTQDKSSTGLGLIDQFKAQMAAASAAKKSGGGGGGERADVASTNFMRQFRDSESKELKQLTAAQFMEVWDHYDDDGKLRMLKTTYILTKGSICVVFLSISQGNGYIEGKELDGFLKEFVSSVNQSDCGPEVSLSLSPGNKWYKCVECLCFRSFPTPCWSSSKSAFSRPTMTTETEESKSERSVSSVTTFGFFSARQSDRTH